MVAGRLTIKSNKFYIVLSYNDKNGNRKQSWFKTGLSVAGNKRKAEKLLDDYRKHFNPDLGELEYKSEDDDHTNEIFNNKDNDILFGDFLLEWLESIKNTIELSTFAGYQINIKSIIAPYFNERGVKLKDLTAKMLDDFYNEKLKSVSPNTVIHYHANIRKALNDAYKNDLITVNVADKAHRPKKENFYCDYYNKDQLIELLENVKGKLIEFPVMMAAYYGLRRSEIIGLKWENIDFDYNVIKIKHTVVEFSLDGKKYLLSKDRAKTNKSVRTLPLVEPIRELLLKIRNYDISNKEYFGNKYSTDYEDYIYKNQLGIRIVPNYITQNFKITLNKIDTLPKIRFHDLRHSCAALLRHEGVPMEDIQKWLGHSQITTTEAIYAHFDNEKHLISANKVLNALKK